MFEVCFKLKKLIFNNNTRTNNLEEMSCMFSECESLENINTEIFKVNKVKNLNYVFSGFKSLKEKNISHFGINIYF